MSKPFGFDMDERKLKYFSEGQGGGSETSCESSS
jgi:hypothetical protein